MLLPAIGLGDGSKSGVTGVNISRRADAMISNAAALHL